jgi:hypothetical protein
MAWACRQTLAMDWFHAGWQKNDSHACRRNSVGVCGQVPSEERHFITTQLCSLVVDELIQELGNGCCKLMYTILICRKFPNTDSQLLQEALSMERHWCDKSVINQSTKGSAPGPISYETRSITVSRTLTIF